MKKIIPIILSGGSGTRLWPLSRSLNPKQFLNFFGKNSLFVDTALRLCGAEFQDPTIICNEEHRFIVACELQKNNIKSASIILESQGRNTAPAIAVAAFDALKKDQDALLLVTPSDHIIKDDKKFVEIINKAAKNSDDFLITFGITANEAHTGYGYIKKGKKINESEGFLVDQFVEKPDLKKAQEFIASKQYFFNSGIFMFKAAKYLEELQKLKPEIYENAKKSYENSQKDLDFIRLNKESFEKCENISIDYAVMEKLAKSNKIAVFELNVGWDDVGNFDAIANNSPKDKDGNSKIGDVVVYDTKNCYVNSQDGRLTSTIGVSDLIVVSTKDVVMVANKKNAQDVKKIYEILQKENRIQCKTHAKVLRPWGSFEVLDDCDGFKVKRIVVKVKSSLSLQMHHKRAEHWIVVKGSAWVTCGQKEFELKTGESTFIPLGNKHRLENKGEVDLEIIEIQTGSYLGEDDIVRFEDIYGR